MLRTLGVVQARFDSPRFRCLASRKIGGQSLLAWVVRRVTDCTCLDGVIVAAYGEPDRRILSRLIPPDVPAYVGRETDPLDHFAGALADYPADAVVRVQGANLFIDPELIDRLVAAAESRGGCDYVSYCTQDGLPAILSSVGVYAEWLRPGALLRAARAAKQPVDRDEVTRYLYTHPKTFRLRFIPAPEAIDRDDIRLTVATEEDWDHAVEICEALGLEALDSQRIVDLLDHQPALRERMAALNRVRSGV